MEERLWRTKLLDVIGHISRLIRSELHKVVFLKWSILYQQDIGVI